MNLHPSNAPAPLIELVSFLATQQNTILENWRIACNQDSLLNKVTLLNHLEFNNVLPTVLAILQQRLLEQVEEGDLAQIATAYGLQRWNKAYSVAEIARELNHLTQALYNELAHFQDLVTHAGPKLLWQVQQQINQIMVEVISGSIQTYEELQHSKAANQTATLQRALDQVVDLLRKRSNRLQTSMHDLRGGFSLISGATTLLKLEGISEQDQTTFLNMLSRNLASVEAMLANLMDLSRLEASEEPLQIQSINAAQLLKEIAISIQLIAEQRGLAFRIDGPKSLLIETDAIKLQRIIQNLLLNALKYTHTGFIAVSWSKLDAKQWMVCVQDSGPGLPTSITERLTTDQLESVVNPTNKIKLEAFESAPVVPETTDSLAADMSLGQPAYELFKGEGIGLRIVKQFSELLGAKLEVKTTQGQGTLFRLWLPTRYF